MNTNRELVEKFYMCFQNLDADGMAACYDADAFFSDPVFPSLKGKEIPAMWKMLTGSLQKSNGPWKLEFSNIQTSAEFGSCHWEAWYLFSVTGRTIHNKIDARFRFKDGKIIEHTDSFSFYRWSRMAFGLTGVMIGWVPAFQRKIQGTVALRLNKFMADLPK